MSDDDNDDLFADSDDTADLIANSNSGPKKGAAAKKKTAPAKKTKKDNKPDADADSDDDLNDSDSEDDEPKKKKAKAAAPAAAKPMSKRERLEALANRKRKDEPEESPVKNKGGKDSKDSSAAKRDKGYDSGDSYDSADFQRTAEDDNFIDTTGEDEDAVAELYAEQRFDDERPDDEDRKKKKKRKIRYDGSGGGGGGDDYGDGGEVNAETGEPDNPIMAAVHRMKKKNRKGKSTNEIEEEVKAFLNRMEMAAEEDEQCITEKKPATKKISLLNEVCDVLTKRDMQRMLLDYDLLSICRRWVQPLPNGTLGNVTVRQRLLEVIGNMTGETGITPSDLKRSEFGKVVMILYKHRSETPAMKRQLKVLIEQWSRPIFQKSGNMKDLERAGNRGGGGLSALSRQQLMMEQMDKKQMQKSKATTNSQDIHSLIAEGNKGKTESGLKRVSVPYSKGFAFQVRPQARVQAPEKGRGRGGGPAAAKDNRGKLAKRMVEKGRTAGKNQRSANISIEGRATK